MRKLLFGIFGCIIPMTIAMGMLETDGQKLAICLVIAAANMIGVVEGEGGK